MEATLKVQGGVDWLILVGAPKICSRLSMVEGAGGSRRC